MAFRRTSLKYKVHPLLHVIDLISKAFINDKVTVAVFHDFSKAFDLVDHTILCIKLNKLGIRDIYLNWFIY